MEVFFGLVFSPTDRIDFPDGRSKVRVARLDTRPDFLQRGTGRSNTLYMGIQIGGVRVSGSRNLSTILRHHVGKFIECRRWRRVVGVG